MTTNADEPGDDTNATTPLPAPAEAATTPLPAPVDAATTPLPGPAEAATAPAEPWLATSVYAGAPRPLPSGPPPVRWGGIVWGILLILFAATTLAVVSSPTRLAGVTVWIATLTPGTALAVWIAALGLIIVVSALLGVIAAAQRNRRRRT